MENIKRVLSYTRRAVDDYEMIHDGEINMILLSSHSHSISHLNSTGH